MAKNIKLTNMLTESAEAQALLLSRAMTDINKVMNSMSGNNVQGISNISKIKSDCKSAIEKLRDALNLLK